MTCYSSTPEEEVNRVS